MAESFFKDEPESGPSGELPHLDDNHTKQDQAGDEFVSDEGRMAAILAYIPFLCFIPLFTMKDNKEARFHARQGVILFLIELVAVLFLVDAISDLVFKGILLLAAGLSVAGIVFAVQGRNYRLPIIGDLADRSKL
ncbi:MAG TPA: hypothetical protein PLF13_13315 [candidate division Zixibacteria bacterium]|nr:hypothetical protein [candidate division Zixibacteria bacterium]